MDERVLEAQKWVNATYGSIPGYNKCPENGRTGWLTMYSLTRALQHELGITTLSDSFGPTTLGKLEQRGGIKLDESNEDIVKIIQCACFCKGYHPGGITGNFGLDTQFAVTSVMVNAGLGDRLRGVVQPKVMKALLTMDAYVVVAGGTETIRSIQQWLNGRYINRKNFFVIPCDGNFSRDVQKAMMMAIQFELGMTDDQATGSFGPGTQAGLRANTVAEGSSGVFVRLFSAAMVFNGYGSFTETFDGGLADSVRKFQSFSQLPDDGRGNFQTWAQLLVSTGDPNRPGTACDGITTITTARARTLHAAGYRIVGRYLDEKPGGNLDKEIKPGELKTIFENDLKVFPISQYYGGERDYFTYTQGFQDALGAHAAAVKYGFNAGTVIYFAVDYDATQEEIESHIVPYFYGVVAGLASKGKRYIHGVYGSRNVCAQVTKHTYARWSFVSGMSTGFSGNMGFPLPGNWAFNQIQTLSVGSGDGRIEIDKNVYRPGSDPAVSSVNDPSSPVDDFVAYIQNLYDLAKSYGKGNPNQCVMEFLRHEDYSNYQWEQMLGELDQEFVAHVKRSGVRMIKQYRDPFYGVDIMVSHFGASCNGVFLKGKPDGTSTNRGDVAGWGGDWMTFYGEWRRDSDSYSSGYTYCNERLGKVDGDGTFKLRDLIEDADAYNIGMKLRSSGTIADEVRNNLKGGGHLTRLTRFYEGRFGGNPGTAASIAKDMLMPGNDIIVNAGRIYLIQTTGGIPTLMPHLLPDDKLNEFCKGYGDVLQARVGQENARAVRLRAEGKA